MVNTYPDISSGVLGVAPAFAANGVIAVGRYYDYGTGSKVLTRQEAQALHANGIGIWIVFEFGGNHASYFTARNGTADAQRALECAMQIVGQPQGTAIYFAADYDEDGQHYEPGIVPYFRAIRDVFTRADGTMPYQIGVYSDGLVCRRLLDDDLVSYAWLSCSSSFPEHAQFLASGRWNISQTCGVPKLCGVSVDQNVVNAARADFGAFTTTVPLTASHAAAPAAQNAQLFADRANTQEQGVAAAPAPASFAVAAVDIASGEWDFFGDSTYDAAGHHVTQGHTEAEDGYAQRIGQYWLVGTNTPNVDGTDTAMPWSAAFISWVMKTAGAGTRFRYSTQHSVYIYQAIRDFLSKRAEAGYWCQRLNAYKPVAGDIVCWSRQPGIDYDNQAGGVYKGHADIVVDVAGNQVSIIGGNVANSVTKRVLLTDNAGYLTPVTTPEGEVLFAIMANRLG